MWTRLNEDLNCILQRDPAARTRFEVLTCYPGLHALFFHRIAHRCWNAGFHWIGRFISQVSRWLTGIEIHPGARIGRRVFIDHGAGVVIGETADIGDDCTIYQGVTLGGTSLYRGQKRHPTLESGVVVGAGAKVLGGFTVGQGVKIGSNAVVTKPVPAGAIAIGIPARLIEASSSDSSSGAEFSAYGLSPTADDPLSIALHRLINETADHRALVEAILLALKEKGIEVQRPNACNKEDFDPGRLNQLVD
ncbi:MAG: serine O-acetyltransferase [Burkholderiaceae bacterium]